MNLSIDISLLPTCPITGQHMKDPVTTPDGNTYERSAIEQWLTNHTTEPQTRNHLIINQLVPNRVLREMYEKFYSSQLVNSVNIPNRVSVGGLPLGLEINKKQITEDDFDILFTISIFVDFIASQFFSQLSTFLSTIQFIQISGRIISKKTDNSERFLKFTL
jgi:hypothetical protein